MAFDEAALRSTIDRLLEGVQVVGHDWTYLYLNDAAVGHGRQPREDLLGRTMMACYPGIEHTEMFAALGRVMGTRRAERLHNEFTYPNGQTGHFELRIEPVPEGLCILSIDVTEQHRLEQQMRQAQRMEALGQLAGGVAHDFNNLLTAILGYCDLLLDVTALDPGCRADVQEVRQAGATAAALTRQLLAFGRKQLQEPITLDINTVVNETTRLLERLVGEHITIRRRLEPSLRRVQADPNQVSQILINLVVNARDAMPNGGRVTIETHNVDLNEAYAGTHFSVVPGPYVQLVVSDTGSGMTPDVQARLFEPFFTTKGTGQGTGLGLAGVYGIVKQNDGNIWVYSEPGKGTTFKIYWPYTVADVDALPAPLTEAGAAASVGGTVLIAEDNPALLTLATRVLQKHGFQVLASRDPTDALRVCEAFPSAIDVLLTDIVMPRHSGTWLAAKVLKRRPEVRIIQMSGHAEEAIGQGNLPRGKASFLQKPFTPDALVKKVREVLVAPA